MDSMIQSYMEETEDMLQKAEECIIRLETEYSSVDVNELFRIAHTIKGSSHMVGYEDIGNLMHKIEDMLDCARNGSTLFDRSIVAICFEGLDTAKKMLQYKKEPGPQELMMSLVNAASGINERVEVFIRMNKKEERKTAVEQPGTGIVSSLLNRKPKGRNKYYITFFIEEDAPMVSPVLILILKSVEDIGTLVYSSVTDNYFCGCPGDNEIKTFDIIICTDIDEAELYTYFPLFYVEKINIVDLTRSKPEENDHCFNDAESAFDVIILRAFMKLYNILVKRYDGQANEDEKLCYDIRAQMANLMESAYNHTKGKHIISIFKSGKDGFINKLRNFMGMVNKSATFIFLIDLSKLAILHENEVKDLIEIKKQLEDQGIEIGIVAEGSGARRIINIFDSIKPIEEFHVYRSQLDAISGIFDSDDSFQRISNKLKDVQYE